MNIAIIIFVFLVLMALIIKWGLAAERKASIQRWQDAKLDPETRKLLRNAGYPV